MSNVIEIKNLQFSYANKRILNIESFIMASTENLFLRGPSGSGKSTLLNIISGVLEGYKGKLTVLDTEISKMTSNQRDQFRCNNIGYIFQQFNLIPYLSVLENIQLPYKFSIKPNKEISKESILRLFNHLKLNESLLNSLPIHLSVGQQQRVAAVRALITKPNLIIADEPTSSLDEESKDAFIELLINEARETKTNILFVSHDHQLASHFDRTVELSQINTAFEEQSNDF